MPPRSNLGLALMLCVVICAWGGNYVVMKLAVAHNGPWAFNALRYGLAVLLLAPALAFGTRAGWRGLLPLPGERLPTVVVGLLQASVVTSFSTWALTRIDASQTVLIVYSMPVWALFFGFLLSRERVTLRVILSLALGIGGLAVLCAPWSMDWTRPGALAGSASALVAALGWALGAVFYRRRTWRSSFASQVFLQMLTAAIAGLALALLFETTPLAFDAPYAAIVVYNALVPTILAYWVWAKILTRIPAATAGQFVLLSPLFGLLLGAFVLSEPLTLSVLLSAAMILGGALMAYIRPRAA